MGELFAVIGVIFAILNIILFFKIWGMCDNVRRMTEHFCSQKHVATKDEDEEFDNDDQEDENEHIAGYRTSEKLLGGESSVCKRMLGELNIIAKRAVGTFPEDYVSMYGQHPEEELVNVISKYKKIYKDLGKEFPEEIENIHTLDDLWSKIQ